MTYDGHSAAPSPPKVLFILMFVLLLVYACVTHFLGTHLWLAVHKMFTQSSPCVNFFCFKNIIFLFSIGLYDSFRHIQTTFEKCNCWSPTSDGFRLRWGCFIAGMSFACLQPAHHAHHVWVRQTKRVTSWMIRTRGIVLGEICGTSQRL